MADIYGSHFEYAGISSRRYGLIIASVESNRNTQVSGVVNGISIFSKNAKKRYLIDDDYDDFPTSFEVDIVIDNDHGIELNDRREIEKWLFNKHDYRRLYLDTADDCFGETYEIIDGLQKQLYLNCRFINPQRLEYNGGIVGYRVTLEADSGLWWQDAVIKSYTINNASSSSTKNIIVNVDTDLDDYTYPKVTITMGSSGGDIIITNNTDDSTRLTKFVGLSANASIVLKGEINYVSGQYYVKFNKQNFPRLLDGDNAFTITGNVKTISFEFNNRRML